MAAIAQPALGTLLAYSTDGGSVYVPVGQVTSITGVGGGEMGKRDTTVLASTLHTAAPTIATKGPMTFGILFDSTDTAHQTIRDWSSTPAATIPKWKVTFPWTGLHIAVFDGFVESFDGANAEDVDSNVEAEVSIFVNSIPVWS